MVAGGKIYFLSRQLSVNFYCTFHIV
jgi:hypothetical protein